MIEHLAFFGDAKSLLLDKTNVQFLYYLPVYSLLSYRMRLVRKVYVESKLSIVFFCYNIDCPGTFMNISGFQSLKNSKLIREKLPFNYRKHFFIFSLLKTF